MRLRRSRLGLAGTAALLVPLVLIACTATPPDEPAADSDVRLPPGPSVEFEGEIDAWSVAMVDCLVDAGWDARLDGEPGEGVYTWKTPAQPKKTSIEPTSRSASP